MQVRRFVLSAALLAISIPAAAVSAQKLTPQEKAAHALSRLTFGARYGDLDRVLQMGVERWINQQLRPETIPDSALKATLARVSSGAVQPERVALVGTVQPSVRKGAGDSAMIVVSRQRDSVTAAVAKLRAAVEFRRVGGAPLQWLARADASDQQLLEVMTAFWENHFSIYSGKMPSRDAIVQYDEEIIRPRALGKFRDLLGAVAHSPAMLFYLDNHLSGAEPGRIKLKDAEPAAPRSAANSAARTRVEVPVTVRTLAAPPGLNENYARELLELHTLGVDGGYTQQDVIEVARAFTGWTLPTPRTNLTFRFDSLRHDAERKTVLGVQLASGRGVQDGEQVLDILARHPSTARFIARKLAVRFVGDEPPDALVARAAKTFTATDGDIREVLKTILLSDEFFAREAFRSKVKNHVELVASMRRAVGAPATGDVRMTQLLNEMGQPLFGRLTPDGWPESGSAWMNFGSMYKRVDLALQVAGGEHPSIDITKWAGWDSTRALPFDSQVDAVVRHFLGGSASAETRAAMLAARAGDTTLDVDGEKTLRELIGLALSSPEFQRR